MLLTPYHAAYFAHELTKRNASDSLEKLAGTLVDAQVDLNPHQVDAALFAFRSPLSKGAILADEVGLGKTIEAGLVISQKWAERKRRMLVIAPASLRKQWSQELADKFFLPSLILEKKSFDETIRQGHTLNPFEQECIVICSYPFARGKEPYLRRIAWDLVVLDEAHRLRNVYRSDNRTGQALKSALANQPKILLTATPLQNSLLELYGLVSLVDEYTFGDLKSFKSQYSNPDAAAFAELKERLRPICQRTLRKQVLEYIRYTDRIALVEEFYPSDDEQRLYDLVTEYLQQPTLYALPNSQRQLMTLILRRLLASSTFAIAGTLRALAGKLELASSPDPLDLGEAGGDDTTDELTEEWEDDDDTEGEAQRPPFTEADKVAMRIEAARLREFQQLAERIRVNSKGQKVMTALERGFAEMQRLGAARKAIIFTESTRTQAYLRDLLRQQGFPGEIVLFNGSNTDEDSKQIYLNWLREHRSRSSGSPTADKRAALVDYFREEATVMIATEAAAEGINLQFCSLVINYDMPWNPQRIEQRIGRCHRYGQRHDVVVVNFLNKANAADVRVYELLNEKFNLFSGVFGASDEVLGTLESGVDFEKRIARIYQTCRSPEQIDAAFDALKQDLEGEITERISHTKIQLLENFDEEVTAKLRMRGEDTREALDRYETWLWQLTRFSLPDADFDENACTFDLRHSPVPGVTLGRYHLGKNEAGRRHVGEAQVYRLGHPLAQWVLDRAKTAELPVVDVTFDYAGTGKKIGALEPFRGQAGWLRLDLLTANAFDTEDHLLPAAFADDGTVLDAEVARKLFSLNGSCHAELVEGRALRQAQRDKTPPSEALDAQTAALRHVTLSEVEARNLAFFDTEYQKLDHWAEDLKVGLERELRDLDAQIKLDKAEVRRLPDLAARVTKQRLIKDLERRRDDLRRTLFSAQDEIDQKKETLLADVETRMKQRVVQKTLFTIRWKLI